VPWDQIRLLRQRGLLVTRNELSLTVDFIDIMPRRKRVKDEEEVPTPEKRAKTSPSTRRSTRISVPDQPTSSSKATTSNGKNRKDIASKASVEDDAEVLSDSSSLSDPPSVIVAPSPPTSSHFKKMIKGKASKIAAAKKAAQLKKPSPKEHEEALNLFIRDDSEDGDLSDSSDETKPLNGKTIEMSGSDEDEDWEEVDLSHKRQVSLNDLNPVEEAPDLEVTLERTQQSMRIKYKPP
jgi:hypothetical protein